MNLGDYGSDDDEDIVAQVQELVKPTPATEDLIPPTDTPITADDAKDAASSAHQAKKARKEKKEKKSKKSKDETLVSLHDLLSATATTDFASNVSHASNVLSSATMKPTPVPNSTIGSLSASTSVRRDAIGPNATNKSNSAILQIRAKGPGLIPSQLRKPNVSTFDMETFGVSSTSKRSETAAPVATSPQASSPKLP
jgi:hypothetical protein